MFTFTGPARLEAEPAHLPNRGAPGGRFLVVINPSGRARVLPHDRPELAEAKAVRHTGVKPDQATITAGPFSFGIPW
jgi:hypothetical protein